MFSRGIWDIVPVLAIHNRHEELFSQTVSQNSSSSTREYAPTQDLEPELFLEEPEPYQMGPKLLSILLYCHTVESEILEIVAPPLRHVCISTGTRKGE